MVCECTGCAVLECTGSPSRPCGWVLGKNKRRIRRCHWCLAEGVVANEPPESRATAVAHTVSASSSMTPTSTPLGTVGEQVFDRPSIILESPAGPGLPMVCECTGVAVVDCTGSPLRPCGCVLGKKKHRIRRCRWCLAEGCHWCLTAGEVANIRLEKVPPRGDVFLTTHHNRHPDIGPGISIMFPWYDAEASTTETTFYGHYKGHGQSKTVFEIHKEGHRFHDQILKVTKQRDTEPSVFKQADLTTLTTSILYECEGVVVEDDSGDHSEPTRFHSWITETTIPLDEFCQYEHTIKSKCCLAAACCMLKATKCGLYLSDCALFNFGVKVTDNNREHVVVIIDAGSRGIVHPDERWTKGEINKTIMCKFWSRCKDQVADHTEIKEIWKNSSDFEDALTKLTNLWRTHPLLTFGVANTRSIRQEILARKKRRA